jgi:hypothetical protein
MVQEMILRVKTKTPKIWKRIRAAAWTLSALSATATEKINSVITNEYVPAGIKTKASIALIIFAGIALLTHLAVDKKEYRRKKEQKRTEYQPPTP